MQIVNIDLKPQKEKPVVELSQFDNNVCVRFALFDNGEEFTLTGTETVSVNIKKPDGNIVVISPTIGANKYVDVYFTEQACACYGRSFGELSIESSEDTVQGTCNFNLDIEISPLMGGVESDTAIENLTSQIEEIISGEGYVKSDDLSSVAFSGDYDDLSDKPDIPTKTSDLTNDSDFVSSVDLAAVAFSGNYNDLSNKPAIPAAQVQSDWNEEDNTKPDYIKNKPTIPAAQVNSDWNSTGGVSEILNKPTIPTKTSDLINDSDFVTETDLILASGVEDQTPYLTRPLPPNAGNRLLDMIVGGTVAFNQLIPDASIHETGTGTGGWILLDQRFSLKNNHVYLCLISGTFDSESLFRFRDVPANIASNEVNGSFIYKSTADTNGTTGLQPNLTNGVNYDFYYNVIDLTALFGSSTIADYVYTLESGTAGAGVNWLKAHGFIAKDYYAYNSGTLVSVKPTKHIEYDSGNNVIGSYDLDTPDLYGLFKLDANNKLYADGNTYKANGEVGLRYGIVDLGSLSYTKLAVSDYFVFHTTLSDKALNTNAICDTFVNSNSARDSLNNMEFGTYNMGGGRNIVCFRDDSLSSGDETAFKTAMSGKYLVYELATPTTTTADPFTNPQVCENGGSEEYTDTREYAVPVGHDTIYKKKNNYRYWG